MSAYLPSISVARESFTDEFERNIMKYFSNGSFMRKHWKCFKILWNDFLKQFMKQICENLLQIAAIKRASD